MKYGWTTISVTNLDASIKFYKEIIGLSEMRRFPAGPGMEIAFLGEGETQIELICDVKKQAVTMGPDISLGFLVDSLDEMMAFVKEKGIEIQDGPIQPNPHLRFFHILDPNGLRIQLVEILK